MLSLAAPQTSSSQPTVEEWGVGFCLPGDIGKPGFIVVIWRGGGERRCSWHVGGVQMSCNAQDSPAGQGTGAAAKVHGVLAESPGKPPGFIWLTPQEVLGWAAQCWCSGSGMPARSQASLFPLCHPQAMGRKDVMMPRESVLQGARHIRVTELTLYSEP